MIYKDFQRVNTISEGFFDTPDLAKKHARKFSKEFAQLLKRSKKSLKINFVPYTE